MMGRLASVGAALLGGFAVCCACARVYAQAPAPPATGPGTPSPAAEAAPSPVAATATAEPAPEVQAEYRAVVQRAVAEFDAGRWAEARAHFLRAHELWPNARTLRTLGMTSFELRAYVRALQELQAALEDPRRPLDAVQRREAADLIERTQPFVGRYRVQLSPPGATLLLDGAPRTLGPDSVLLLELGEHELLARATAHEELRRRVTVQGREDEAIALELQPTATTLAAAPAPVAAPVPSAASPPREAEPEGSSHLWTWVAAGATVALAGSSIALWLASDSEFDAEFKKCHQNGPDEPATCSEDEVDSWWEDLQTAHQIILGLAIASGAGAVALFFLEGGAESAAPAVAIGPGAVSVYARF